MQKRTKRTVTAVLVAILMFAVGIICACKEQEQEQGQEVFYTAKYGFQDGGYITGDTEQTIKKGESGTSVQAVPKLGYKFVAWNDGVTTSERADSLNNDLNVEAVFEVDAFSLPVMQIVTQDAQAITSKEDYVTCGVSVGNAEETYCFADYSAKIKGRGNTTWNMPKKAYKLKFDSKVDLFGNGSAKTWTLIANYCDQSLIRNYLAYVIGASFDDIGDTTTKVQFVDLYLNGQYDGVYLVCEQNEVGKTRVNIEDDFNKAPDPKDMGFLIELDGRAPDEGEAALDCVVAGDNNYAIKSPDYTDIVEGEHDFSVYADYIKSYLQASLNALDSGDFEQVTNYLDPASFADAYIVHELFNSKDVDQASFYVYKKGNGKLYCGPIWDFDVSSGNCNFNDTAYQENDSKNPNCLWAKELNVWYRGLLEYAEFNELVSARLKLYEERIVNLIDDSIMYVYSCADSFERNFERWDTLGKPVWPNPEEIIAITTWQGQVEYLRGWLSESLEYMLSVYCPET